MVKEVNYVVYFCDESGNPIEFAASSTSLEDAAHYLWVYSEDGRAGLFKETVLREPIQFAGVEP